MSRRRWNRLGSMALAGIVLAGGAARAAETRLELEIEGGSVRQSRNDVEIPNDGSATRFSLVDLIGTGPAPAGRAYLTWNLTDRQSLRALAAPLRLEGSGTSGDPVVFAGGTFAANTPIDGTYEFNSWRITYRYRLGDGPGARAWIGFTAKLRDAKVELRQGSLVARDTDLGFVPLLHAAADLPLSGRLRLLLDADALAGGPGRAIDAAAKLGVDVSDALRFTVGYRTLEGGADVDEVYNFAWIHYAVASVVWRPGA